MKSKIKEVVSTKPFTNIYGTTHYHCLVMENGDKINIGKKSILQVGWELNYEITETGQQEYQKAKSIQDEVPPAANNQAQPTSNFQKASVQDDILYSVCLKGAMDFYLQINERGIEEKYGYNPENICSMALEVAKQAKKDIETLKNS